VTSSSPELSFSVEPDAISDDGYDVKMLSAKLAAA